MPSSVIEWMQYDPASRALRVAFRARREVYQYLDVSPREWELFRAAPSKGTYLNRTFKRREHPFAVVRDARGRRSLARNAKLTWTGADDGVPEATTGG